MVARTTALSDLYVTKTTASLHPDVWTPEDGITMTLTDVWTPEDGTTMTLTDVWTPEDGATITLTDVWTP
jgi:hypothetical protein